MTHNFGRTYLHLPRENTNEEKKWFYVDRIVGGGRHHWNFDGHPVTSCDSDPVTGSFVGLSKQSATDGIGNNGSRQHLARQQNVQWRV